MSKYLKSVAGGCAQSQLIPIGNIGNDIFVYFVLCTFIQGKHKNTYHLHKTLHPFISPTDSSHSTILVNEIVGKDSRKIQEIQDMRRTQRKY